MLISDGIGHIEKSEERKNWSPPKFKALDQIPLYNDASVTIYSSNLTITIKIQSSLFLESSAPYLMSYKIYNKQNCVSFCINLSSIIETSTMDLGMGEE